MPSDQFGSTLIPFLQQTAEDYGSILYDALEPYPPPTAANSPDNPKGRWYERGYGERWRRRNGTIGGRPTSNQLGERWAKEIEVIGDDEVDMVLVNLAQNQLSGTPYAAYVQGEVEDQSTLHQGIGWKSVDTALEETQEELDSLFDATLDIALENL